MKGIVVPLRGIPETRSSPRRVRERTISAVPIERPASTTSCRSRCVTEVTVDQLLGALMAARGRCCGSLAVSKLPRPGLPGGEAIERRVGFLEHIIALVDGGTK